MSKNWSQNEKRPDPDPTRLTTAAVKEASEMWRRELQCLREIIESRLHEHERVYADHVASVPELRAEFQRRLTELDALHHERFDAVTLRFTERDLRFRQQDAFIQRATQKAEDASTRQSEQLGLRLEQAQSALSTQIGDVKGRLDKFEGSSTGERDKVASARLNIQLAIAGFVALLVLGGTILSAVAIAHGK